MQRLFFDDSGGFHLSSFEMLPVAESSVFEHRQQASAEGWRSPKDRAVSAAGKKQRWSPSTRASGGTVKGAETAQAGLRAPLQSVRQDGHPSVVVFEKFNGLLVGHASPSGKGN
jgi:hypothetical protein